MKTAALLVAASVFAVSSVFAASAFAQSTAPAPVNVPPPPGINDPGVQAVTPAAKPAPASSSNQLNLKPQKMPSPPRDAAASDAKNAFAPDVSVRTEGENTIQEYRRSGRIYMVVVTPKHGIPHTYVTDPQGRLVDEHGQKPIRPVMYKILEWGKSKPAAAASSADAADPADVK
ncbi:MAG: DUF2782 domain-containing protein [Rhodanobacter sp.]